MRTPFPTRATRGASLRCTKPESRRHLHSTRPTAAVNSLERGLRGGQLALLALALVVATANGGCALAMGEGLEVAAMSRLALAETAAGEAAMLGARGALAGAEALGTDLSLAETVGSRAMFGARGMAAATGLGMEATELTAFRGAASELFGSRSLLGMGRANVVLRNGTVLAEAEATGAESLAIRSSRSGITVDAVRAGSRVEYRVGGRTVGYSELERGRVQHYLRYSGTDRYAGYDIIEGNRVFQYDASGRLLADTSLEAIRESGTASIFGIAAVAAGVTNDRVVKSKEDKIEKQIQVLLGEIDRFSRSRRQQ